MKKHRKHKARKIGLPPGSLVHVGEVKTEKPMLSIFEYSASHLREKAITPTEIEILNASAENKLWLNVHGLHDAELIRSIGKRFGLHPLVMEDILNTEQRPKADNYDSYLYLVTRFFYYDKKTFEIGSEQISLVLGANFVLSFQERATGSFEPVRERMRAEKSFIREQGSDYLTYALLDMVVDRYFVVLEQMSEDCEDLEEVLLRKPSTQLLQKIHLLKRASMELRRTVWPLREMLNSLIRNENNCFSHTTLPYLRDVYDHTVHFIESLESIRDLLGGMMDIYLSSISNRVNMEVRALTVVTMLFMPATLITGIFGMNFDVMPWLKEANGFWWAIGLMVLIASSMGLIFWRRQWLSRRNV